jgi:hypothetical protein
MLSVGKKKIHLKLNVKSFVTDILNVDISARESVQLIVKKFMTLILKKDMFHHAKRK